MRLLNKVALITGAGSGIGRATSLLFAQEGAKIAAVDIDLVSAQQTVDTLMADGGVGLAIEADVSRANDAQRMVAATVAELGRLDIVFNNAGIFRHGTVIDTEESEWDRVLNVNLKGVFLVSKYALPHLIANGGGSVINTSSTSGIRAFQHQAAYDASKAGVILLSKQMAIDYAPQMVRVNYLVPGLVDTAQSRGAMEALGNRGDADELWEQITGPLGRAGTADEIAKAALFLASDDSSYMTGAGLVIDGGLTAS
jgi:NAD(P)-dependent dehydrogenase (short-subunit alcohol dehydrogenase family)